MVRKFFTRLHERLDDAVYKFLENRAQRWSLYSTLVVWGASGFMAQPTIASAIYHLTVMPIFLFANRWLSMHVGRRH